MEVDEANSQNDDSYDDDEVEEESYIVANEPSVDFVNSVQTCVQLHRSMIKELDEKWPDRKKEPGAWRQRHKIDFGEAVHHLSVTQQFWGECLENALEDEGRDFVSTLELFKLSHVVLTYIRQMQLSVMNNCRAQECGVDPGSLWCFLRLDPIQNLTKLYCTAVQDIQRSKKLELLKVVLESFMDILDLLMDDLAQNVEFDSATLQDWHFLLSIPWVRGIGEELPCCISVPAANELRNVPFCLPPATVTRCLFGFRFEVFYSFSKSIFQILKHCLTNIDDGSTLGLVQLIGGLHWPILTLQWKTILTLCCRLIFMGSNNSHLNIALAEALVRLPCAYVARIYFKSKSKSKDQLPFYPTLKVCPACDTYSGSYSLFGSDHKVTSSKIKLTLEDATVILAMFQKLLDLKIVSVHARLANVFRTLRAHSNISLVSLTRIFWKSLQSTTPYVQRVVAAAFGVSTRERKRLKSMGAMVPLSAVQSLPSSFLSTQVVPNLRMSTASVTADVDVLSEDDDVQVLHIAKSSAQAKEPILALKHDDTEIKSKRKVNGRNPNATPPSKKPRLNPSSNIGLRLLKATVSSTVRLPINYDDLHDHGSVGFVSQRDILTKSKTAPKPHPPIGRFDSADLLYSLILSRFYIQSSQEVAQSSQWELLVQYHTVLKTLSKYTDGDVWTAEILKCYIHLLGRFESRFAIILSHSTFQVLSRRAGCSPEELLGRYREVVANEIRGVCLHSFSKKCSTKETNSSESSAKENSSESSAKETNSSISSTKETNSSVNSTKETNSSVISQKETNSSVTSQNETNSCVSQSDACIPACGRYFRRVCAAADMMQRPMKEMLLRIVLKRCALSMFEDDKEKAVVAAIAAFCHMPVYKFLKEEFAYYCPFVMIHIENDERLKKFLTSLQLNFKINPAAKEIADSIWLHTEMLSHISEYKGKVIKQYEHIIKWHEKNQSTCKHSVKKVGDALNTNSVAVVITFHKKFLSQAESIVSKRKYLMCLGMLLGILGKDRVGQSKFKIFSSLNELANLGPKHHDLLRLTWGAFLKNLDDDSLTQIGNQIFAAMYPFRNSNNQDLEDFIKQLVLPPDSPLHSYVHRLYFLDEYCVSKDVIERIRSLAQTSREATTSKTFIQLAEDIGHENSHIRRMAGMKMKLLLKNQFLDLDDINYENQIFSSQATTLMRNLLTASKEAGDEMKAICASCLGSLGALDPRRFDLQQQLSANARLGLTSYTVGQTDFTVYFIEELARILQSSDDTTSFDECACCIQELLRFYKITTDEADGVWSRLSSKAKGLIDPLHSSRYRCRPVEKQIDTWPVPIFQSDYGKQFTKWMYYCIKRMIDFVKTEDVKSFFNIAKLVSQRSDQAGLALLPYVASYAVMEGSNEGTDLILQEFKAVLGSWMKKSTQIHDPSFKPQEPPRRTGPDSSSSIKPDILSQVDDRIVTISGEDSKQLPFCATQAVFKVLDHFDRIVRNPKVGTNRKNGNLTASQKVEKASMAKKFTAEDAKPIKDLQIQLHYDTLARAAFECHNFARALMYLEQHIKEHECIDTCLNTLQKIYVALYDEDSIKGIAIINKKEDESVMDGVLNRLCQGQLEQCTPLLEVTVAECPNDILYHQQLVYAYLALSQHDLGHLLLNGALYQNRKWSRSFDEAKLEIHLKQRNFDQMHDKVQQMACDKLATWGATMSQAFWSFNQADFESVTSSLRQAKIDVISQISSAVSVLDMGFYFRHYKDLIRLQLITELEEAVNLASETSPSADFEKLAKVWASRLKSVHKSPEILQSIISFRKTVLEITKNHYPSHSGTVDIINLGIRKCCTKLAKLEAGVGNHIRANQFLLESKMNDLLSVFYDEAKMLADAGKFEECLKVVDKGLNQNNAKIIRLKKSAVSDPVSYEQKMLSKAVLLYAQQMDSQRKVDLNMNVINYEVAIDVNKTSEDNYFHLACYYDRLWGQAEDRANKSDVQILMVKNYSSSLQFGCSHVYQSLPRLLTIWFDYAAQDSRSSSFSSSQRSGVPARPETVEQLTGYIKKLVGRAPAYIFIVVFSQLISRLAHSNSTVYKQLKEILTHMVIKHPQQVLWMMMGVLKSTYKIRVTRCNEILDAAKNKERSLKGMITSYKELSHKLIKFTMTECGKLRYVNASEILPELPTLIRSSQFGYVLVPFQEFMKPQLPRKGIYVDSYSPFSSSPVHIDDIFEPVQLMTSLQRPKRICLKGTNGKKYSILCKPSDDLRKDGKVMEINSMVHWYMSQEKECRKRNLIIRTYAVTPLNDSCGLIEWIPNLNPFRMVIMQLYDEGYGKGQYKKQSRGRYCDKKDDIKRKRKVFEEALLAVHPPVLSYWFLKTFPEPQSWYVARNSYVRTAAVMSIVGFLMGLGDRHGENLLLDASNGDIVHVDFNCLFNKGETFEWPERVPFRLTQNMIDGMGPLRYEGPFRRCCEIVMRLIRNHSSVFLSIIRPFVFDPLLEWDSQNFNKNRAEGECSNKKAVEHLNNIRDRLLGSARNFRERNVALSVEAHVNYLIQESTLLDNLCQMYFGWAAYL